MARHRTMTLSHPIIAVVEDDAAVRNSLKFSLEIDGFSVRTYANAEELLGSSNLKNFQCLIVDQDMPRMTGLELVAVLRERGVEVPALLVSGHPTPAVTRQASAAGIPVIEKPFLGNGLIESIRAAVGTRPN
jgi:FixJ family two-component response regulator